MEKKHVYRMLSKGFHLLAGVSLVSVLALSLMTSPAQGQFNTSLQTNINSNVRGVAEKGYNVSGTQDLPTVIGGYIKVFLGILGMVAILLMVYAGYKWMTAQHEAKQVQEAKDLIKNAVIGLILISLAYALTNFVFQSIINASST